MDGCREGLNWNSDSVRLGVVRRKRKWDVGGVMGG